MGGIAVTSFAREESVSLAGQNCKESGQKHWETHDCTSKSGKKKKEGGMKSLNGCSTILWLSVRNVHSQSSSGHRWLQFANDSCEIAIHCDSQVIKTLYGSFVYPAF
ncbi:hypothetical protein GE21DRAFT_1308153 [Neurospora crassa]|nr:hypothetical protein GE21DRAFT_1308153 [Neurospora crassa]